MNQEVAVIDVIERILSQMLPDEWARARVVSYFSDKYPQGEVPQWDESEAGQVSTPAVPTNLGQPGGGFGHGWGGLP